MAIFLVSPVIAFSVSKPYMENNQLRLMPGDTSSLNFVVQNGGGVTESVSMKVQILKGSEVVSLVNESEVYVIPAGGRVTVPLSVNIPSTANIGDSYSVELGFVTSTGEDVGSFAFGSSISSEFGIVLAEPLVVEKTVIPEVEEEFPYGVLIVLIVAIVIVLLIIIKVKSKKNNSITPISKSQVQLNSLNSKAKVNVKVKKSGSKVKKNKSKK